MESNKFESLQKACADYLAYVEGPHYHEDGLSNFENEVFEKAMEAFYGPKIWDRVNDVMMGGDRE